MRLFKSFKFAFCGLFSALKSEKNLQIHVIISILVIIAGFFFRISLTEWVAVLLCIALVISVELLNTAIEKLSDFVCKEKNSEIGYIKDISAAAVVVCAIISAVIGVIIFLPKIF